MMLFNPLQASVSTWGCTARAELPEPWDGDAGENPRGANLNPLLPSKWHQIHLFEQIPGFGFSGLCFDPQLAAVTEG